MRNSIFLVFTLFIISGCTSRPIESTTVPTFDQITIQEIIDTVNENKYWTVKTVNDDSVIVHMNSRHEVVARVTPTDAGLVFDYIYSSVETNDHKVHRNYYRWINNLGQWIKKRAPLTHGSKYTKPEQKLSSSTPRSKSASDDHSVNVNVSSCLVNC